MNAICHWWLSICGGSPFPRSQTLVIDNGLADGLWVGIEDTEEIQTRD